MGMETNDCSLEPGWKQMDVPSDVWLREEN